VVLNYEEPIEFVVQFGIAGSLSAQLSDPAKQMSKERNRFKEKTHASWHIPRQARSRGESPMLLMMKVDKLGATSFFSCMICIMLPAMRMMQNDCTQIQPKIPRLPCLKRIYMTGCKKTANTTSWAIGMPDTVPDIVCEKRENG